MRGWLNWSWPRANVPRLGRARRPFINFSSRQRVPGLLIASDSVRDGLRSLARAKSKLKSVHYSISASMPPKTKHDAAGDSTTSSDVKEGLKKARASEDLLWRSDRVRVASAMRAHAARARAHRSIARARTNASSQTRRRERNPHRSRRTRSAGSLATTRRRRQRRRTSSPCCACWAATGPRRRGRT